MGHKEPMASIVDPKKHLEQLEAASLGFHLHFSVLFDVLTSAG